MEKRTIMLKRRWMATVAVVVLNVSYCVMQAWGQDSKPLLTIACLSDLHNQTDLIQGDVSSVKLRGTILTTLSAIKNDEDIDMMVLGGDYTSDCTIPEENWSQVRKLMRNATRAAFNNKTKRPVLYVTGNHDYEVANVSGVPKAYNAARYYEYAMRNDIGELSNDDSFYEEVDNGSSGSMRLLAAYHYRIKGFDFVVLNCGKNLVHNNWNYFYSMESVEWVGNKLNELCAQDSRRTILFCVHIPFGDSNSISSEEKGIGHDTRAECSVRLKEILAAHPNVIMLYGHDHGNDAAYTRERTSQRVTRYDEWGEIINTIDEDHFDEPIAGLSANPEQVVAKNYSLQNLADEKYLTWQGGMAMTGTSTPCKLTETGDGRFYMELNKSGKYLMCNSEGKFWGGDKMAVTLYKIDLQTESSITAHRVEEMTEDGNYVVTATNGSQAYALTNDKCDPTSIAILFDGTPVTPVDDTLQMDADPRVVWTIRGARSSFLSEFMGSMRYYSNALDGNVGPKNSRIIQALMIYVHPDSIVFRIKNYGESGTFSTSNGTLKILTHPAAYTVRYQQPDYSEQVASDIQPFADYPGTGCFRMSSENAETLTTAIAAAREDHFISGEEYDDLQKSFEAYVDFPETGHYLIKNCQDNGYLAYGTPGEQGMAKGLVTTNGAVTPANIIKLTKVGLNAYTLSSQGLNVQKQTEANSTFAMTDTDGAHFAFIPQNAASLKIINADSYRDADHPGTLAEASLGEPKAVVNQTPDDAKGEWTAEATSSLTVALTPVGDYSYSTLCLPFGVTLPSDVKAYILTVNGQWAVPHEIAQIPANTGVLLRAASNVTSAELTIDDTASANTGDNMLLGTNVDITGERLEGEYILGVVNNMIGFYQRGAGYKIGANKAYFQLGSDIANEVKGIILNFDDITGIASTAATKKNNSIYDLAGRRVQTINKGIYITNGRKVVVK